MKAKPFDVNQVRLRSSNLIEASAGTGKTYSIAVLVLRLVMEENIPIQEVLMVTFTKAAVAELENRIRSFIRQAWHYSQGKKIKDPTITYLVDRAMQSASIGEEMTKQRLRLALLFLDETAVLTIHSFCQRTLSEYAFETKQVFGSEAMDESTLLELKTDQVNRFWRDHIITLPPLILEWIEPDFFSRKQLLRFVDEILSGKSFKVYSPENTSPLKEEKIQQLITLISPYQEVLTQCKQRAEQWLNKELHRFRPLVEKYVNAQKAYLSLLDDKPLLLDQIILLKDKNYTLKIFQEVLDLMEPAFQLEERCQKEIHHFSLQLYHWALNEIKARIQHIKEAGNMLTFDDMIDHLHHAVVEQQSEPLKKELHKKYKAVFIDEFQDTDRKQYEIFHTLFQEPTIIFYIGDPKQSIYAWRKADIYTYFKAGQGVSNRYEMNTNYRSSAPMIQAQNRFFKPKDDFDTFYFQDDTIRIDYTEVGAPHPPKPGGLFDKGNPEAPLSVFEVENVKQIDQLVCALVIQLLTEKRFTLGDPSDPKAVKPSDIGILVRKNQNGRSIQERLARFKIPAITIHDNKLTESQEAQDLTYVLQAVIDINTANINRALLVSITGLKIEDLKNLQEENVIQRFKVYQLTWIKNGVYVMLIKFMSDFKIKSKLLSNEAHLGERKLSNLLQLLEVLHKVQTKNQYSPAELVNWLNLMREGKLTDVDEYIQRLESDQDAVKIVTIHKSKGLEYPIVIAPNLDLTTKESEILTLRDETLDGYVFGPKNNFTEEESVQVARQTEQENRRLIYVALTRAKYKCYVISCQTKAKKEEGISAFLKVLKPQEIPEIVWPAPPSINYAFNFRSQQTSYPVRYAQAAHFKLTQLMWRRMSFTGLSPEHQAGYKSRQEISLQGYDEFIFQRLRKGAYAGNLLHYLLEYAHFSDTSQWDKVIAQALQRLPLGSASDESEHLRNLLTQVTQCTLVAGEHRFSLSEVGMDSRLSEFEFDYPVPPTNIQELLQASGSTVPLQVKPTIRLEGMMNGKMDLFFEYQGRYYILDWKSNHLGDQLSDYEEAGLLAAMEENNYHLQYHIYAAALHRYLTQRLAGYDYNTHFGGVFYLFVRGIRKGLPNGIFYRKPPLSSIKAWAFRNES